MGLTKKCCTCGRSFSIADSCPRCRTIHATKLDFDTHAEFTELQLKFQAEIEKKVLDPVDREYYSDKLNELLSAACVSIGMLEDLINRRS